ncbi:MAG: glycerate kinase [Synergistaceae bacterium]|nr:glycerate kinase [Synergistota bacterium]NLM70339.1 glycerate kinase [Synergistaceae bacterium]
MERIRLDALEIATRAIEAVLPERAVREALEGDSFLERLGEGGNVVLVAIGKAAWRMASAASESLGDRLSGGVVVTKYGHSGGPIDRLEIHEGGHPIPDENGVAGTERALAAVRGLAPEDTVLFLVSGGGSALFESPAAGLSLADIAATTGELLACGADIVEINTIRKRLSSVKGGRFAQASSPAHVYSVVLSDVLGDRLDSIASGPAWPDSATSEDALGIVERYGLVLGENVMDALRVETPKSLEDVTSVITGSVTALCAAAESEARLLGYTPLVLTTTLDCEAREAGAVIASIAREVRSSGRPVRPPCAVIMGGETVVRLTGGGKGGRNQEIALAASSGIRGLEDTVVLSVGSDGTDGPTDAAGGVVDGATARLLVDKGINVHSILAENDSYNALKACGGLVTTGPTGTNVNDLTLLLCGPERPGYASGS